MYIFIEAITGLSIRLKVEPEDSIQSVKFKIMVCEDLPIDEQHLIFQETELEDNKTIKDYKICPSATIRLIMKMRGGPLSPDISYENVFTDSEHSPTNNLSDYLAIMLFENGDYKFVPIFGLEKQNPNLIETKNDLNNADIFSNMNDSQYEHKITILKLKMDYAKLNKRLSSLHLQTKADNKISNDKKDEPQILSKQINQILNRSISLDSRPVGLVSEVSKLLKRPKNNNTLPSQRSPSLGIFRTMSVLDTVKINKTSNTLPYLKDKEINREKFIKYSKSFEKKSTNLNLKQNILKPRQQLPPLNESEEVKKPPITKGRCPICSKKLTLSNEFSCRCGGSYCTKHRYPEEHNCNFDFKSLGQLELMKSNPIIKASKISKI